MDLWPAKKKFDMWLTVERVEAYSWKLVGFRTVEIWLAPFTLEASEGMDHASCINKLVLSNSDKFPDPSAAADQRRISSLWKCPACVHLHHEEGDFSGRGSVFWIVWGDVLCLSGDGPGPGCCRNAAFKSMKPRSFPEKLMIQLLLSKKKKNHHSLGQIFVKAAMFVQLSPLCWCA